MDRALTVLKIYHMYLTQLEALLHEEHYDIDDIGRFLNLIDSIQHEEFAYNWTNPQARWMVEYTSLNVKKHRQVLLTYVNSEREIVDTAATEVKKAELITDVLSQNAHMCAIRTRLFYNKNNICHVAKRFLWEDELIETRLGICSCRLQQTHHVEVEELPLLSSVVDRALGITYLSVETFRNIVASSTTVVDKLCAVGVVEVVSNNIFREKVERRTKSGISQLVTEKDSYIKIQDKDGRDYIAISRDCILYLDDLQL